MRFGELADLITCYQIDRGRLLPKVKKKWTYDEVRLLR